MSSFFVTSPITESESAPADLSLSPAAMFLSSFSPMAAPQALPDDEGESIAGYVLGPMIGHGGFSIIRRASSAQGGVVAVKIVRQADLDKQEDPERARVQLRHETDVWSSLNHEHILPLFSSCHTSYADFFITLYCPAGSLFDILKRDGRPALPQDEAGRMYRQVVKGLRYMHEVAGYVHGDMKLENVMVDDMGVCRIGDFGMAKKIGECESDDEDRPTRKTIVRNATVRQKRSRSRHPLQHVLPSHPSLLRHQCGPRHRTSSPFPSTAAPAPHQIFHPGSLPYASPELLLPSTSSAPYHAHPAQDIWALGVMLYVMLTGRLPFVDSFEPRLQMKILNGAFTMPTDIGRGAERVLQGTLEHSVHDRWTIAMVDEVAWGIGWGSVGDETPPPSLAPRPTRSRSRAHPTIVPEHTQHDHAIADDIDSPRPPSLSASRSRSRPSRPRHKMFHPYDISAHEIDAAWDSPIIRASSSSTGSECLSPMERPEIRTPSTSPDRSRNQSRNIRTVSSSRSPLGRDISPVDLDMGDRGREVSPAIRGKFSAASDDATTPFIGTISAVSRLIRKIDVLILANKARTSNAEHETLVYPLATNFTIPGLHRLTDCLVSPQDHIFSWHVHSTTLEKIECNMSAVQVRWLLSKALVLGKTAPKAVY
ncbi:kinase-like domain-containing protein [Irpex rosettiformis]|uniref:Kinase-like domain-containing protein n=1 Tax=Irpex rosettiformis TaxID=378272 RepID=A0ACB8U2M2_9APHY|nr:kinase-like domain-containing protein [Irpex rosettiformis]